MLLCSKVRTVTKEEDDLNTNTIEEAEEVLSDMNVNCFDQTLSTIVIICTA